MDTIVHIVITGMIVLQPYTGTPGKWRVMVPDLTAHHHVAHIVVESPDLVRPAPTPGTDHTVFLLKGHSGQITGGKAGTGELFPYEMLTYHDLCAKPPGDCTKIRQVPDLNPPPALDLFIDAADLSTTGTYPSVNFYLERVRNGKPVKTPRGEVAEEICLTFTVNSPTFRLNLAPTLDLELKPDASGRVELRIGNTVPPPSGGHKHENRDPHLHHYYDLNKITRPADRAELKNDQTVSGKPWRDHCHKLSLVEVSATGQPIPARSKTESATSNTTVFSPRGSLVHNNLEVRTSFTGSNCPPTGGDPYP